MQTKSFIAAVLLTVSIMGPVFPVYAGTGKIASTTEFFTPAESEAKVRDYFKDIPVMIEIARCESEFRQYTDSGAVLRGGSASGMIGIFQFFESVHALPAKALGFDLTSVNGNLGYARHLYKAQGTVPWDSAKSCWDVKPSGVKAPATAIELQAKIKQLTQLIKLLKQLQELRAKQAK